MDKIIVIAIICIIAYFVFIKKKDTPTTASASASATQSASTQPPTCQPNEPISPKCVRYVIMSSQDYMNKLQMNDDALNRIRNMSDTQLFAGLQGEIAEMQRRQGRTIITNQDLRDALNTSARS